MKNNRVSLWNHAAEASSENTEVNLIITYYSQKLSNQSPENS